MCHLFSSDWRNISVWVGMSNQIVDNAMDNSYDIMGERRGVYRVLVGKPEGKKPLGRPMRRWEYNIKMYTVMKILVPLKGGNF
jgi:hypothetical protein